MVLTWCLSIHPSIIYTCLSLPRGLEPIPAHIGREAECNLDRLAVCHRATVINIDRQLFTLTSTGNPSSINLTCMSLDCGRKLEHRSMNPCAVVCPDFFDWGGPSGALTYVGVGEILCKQAHAHQNSINLPFLFPLLRSTIITNIAVSYSFLHPHVCTVWI